MEFNNNSPSFGTNLLKNMMDSVNEHKPYTNSQWWNIVKYLRSNYWYLFRGFYTPYDNHLNKYYSDDDVDCGLKYGLVYDENKAVTDILNIFAGFNGDKEHIRDVVKINISRIILRNLRTKGFDKGKLISICFSKSDNLNFLYSIIDHFPLKEENERVRRNVSVEVDEIFRDVSACDIYDNEIDVLMGTKLTDMGFSLKELNSLIDYTKLSPEFLLTGIE